MSEYPHQNPKNEAELVMPFMTEEEFNERTGGLRKEDIHPLLVNMRHVGGVRFTVADDEGRDVPITLRPSNMENDAFLPALEITTSDAKTTLRSFSGEKCAITVEPFGIDAEINASISTHRGIEIQDTADFELVPKTHWKALNYAKAAIERDNPPKSAEKKPRKSGGGILRLFK